MSLDVRYVDEPADLGAVRDSLMAAETVAIDTESDSMHCYFEKVCVIQLEADGVVWLIDTIKLRDLSILAPALAGPRPACVLHGADYDVVCLRRDFGFTIDGLFDTMIAAQFLGKPAYGLAALCEGYLGVHLDKSLTRYNWARRPFENKHLRYLANDVIHLRELRDILTDEAVAADLDEEIDLECRRVTELEWTPKTFNPDGWIKIKGSATLDIRQRRAVKELFAVRDEIARQTDLPPFMVFNNEALLKLAHHRPLRMGDLERTVTLNRRLSDDHVRRIIEAIQAAEANREPPARVHGARGPRRSDVEVETEERLRKWRNRLAESTSRYPMAILPNHVLLEVARIGPTTESALLDIRYMGPRRVEKYGRMILDVVRSAAK